MSSQRRPEHTYANAVRMQATTGSSNQAQGSQFETRTHAQGHHYQAQYMQQADRSRQMQQLCATSSTHPNSLHPPTRTQSYAEIAAQTEPSIFAARGYCDDGYDNVTGFVPLVNQQTLQPNRNAHHTTRTIDMRRVPPSSGATGIPTQVNADGLNTYQDFPLYEDAVMDWVNDPRVPEDRTGLTVNSLPPLPPAQPTRSPRRSFAASSASGSGRRSKREIMTGNATHRCHVCGGGFYSSEDRR